MKIYSLTGRAGTGKSYQAIHLCAAKNIESIIDDGLFITQSRVEAGQSAKRQSTRVGAIKTALFTRDEHAESVRAKIKEIEPESILILGTSDEMTDRIARRLELPPITERIYIEDITSPEEREMADIERTAKGKHIIPVSTLQLKRDFAGYFLDPMRFIRERDVSGKKEAREKTVVRPTFSYMGDFYISDTVFTDIAHCVAGEFDGQVSVAGVYENTSPENMIMKTIVDIKEGCKIWQTAEAFQKRMIEVAESMTAYNIVILKIEVRGFIK